MPARSDHLFGFQRLKDRENGFVVHWCLPFHTLEFASYFCPPHRTFFFPVLLLPAPVSLSYFFSSQYLFTPSLSYFFASLPYFLSSQVYFPPYWSTFLVRVVFFCSQSSLTYIFPLSFPLRRSQFLLCVVFKHIFFCPPRRRSSGLSGNVFSLDTLK